MVQAQEWLDRNYPNKQQTKEIWISFLLRENLQGSLTISDYPQLEKIFISQKNLANLYISNCPNLRELTASYSHLTNLNLTQFPNLRILDLSGNSLTNLDLSSQKKLKVLIIWDNRLTKLNINHLKDLEKIDVRLNNLAELNLSNLVNLKSLYCSKNKLLTNLILPQSDKLESLDLSKNNFNQDLSFISHLVNLKELWLANNKFYDSLEFLKDLDELVILDTSDTDIDSNLEYLPESLKHFNCSVDRRSDAKVKVIYDLFSDEQGKVETEGEYSKYIENFPQKLQDYKQWKRFNFSKKEIEEWIKANFQLSNYNCPQEWRKNGFTEEQAKKWTRAGAKAYDYKFVSWLRDVKKETPQWITNYKEDYQILSERFKKYGLCSECSQPNTGEKWCQDCNASRLQENFTSWTSKNPQIDEFIQKYQLQATEANKFLEWIPYEQFTNIKYLAQGGFGKVYKARWAKGSILYWDTENKQWYREKDEDKDKSRQNQKDYDDYYYEDEYAQNKKYKDYREVVLKSLNNSSDNTNFLQETEKHKIIDDWFNNIVPCYGLSQDPQTRNYLMVMQYIKGGDLRHYLSKKLTFQDKLQRLENIIRGLKDIHSKNLVHCDFHSGNILNSEIQSFITDLGLCKPANSSEDKEVHGVLPYVAPELLSKKRDEITPYTPASDIYSLGMIAYEIFANQSPYLDQSHDEFLAVKICQGLRPDLEELKIPQFLKDLIKNCWDADPAKRPTAQELEKTLRDWKKDVKFVQQLQMIEKEYNSQNTEYKKHSTAIMTSKLINTKRITQLLSKSEISNQTINSNSSLTTPEFSQSLQIDFGQLGLDDSQPTEENWQNISSEFTEELIKKWQESNFTYQQCKEWINIGMKIEDYAFCAWLRDKSLTTEEALNEHQEEALRQGFTQWQEQQNQQPQIIQTNLPPRNN